MANAQYLQTRINIINFSIILIFGTSFFTNVTSQSICPNVLTYDESTSQPGRLYGTIKINSEDTLYGIWIDVILDSRAESLVNWVGDISSSNDNTEFKIENKRKVLAANTVTRVRFFIDYDSSHTPRVKIIRLNGRQICSTPVKSIVYPELDNVNNRFGTTDNNYHVSDISSTILNETIITYNALPLNNESGVYNKTAKKVSTVSRLTQTDNSNERNQTYDDVRNSRNRDQSSNTRSTDSVYNTYDSNGYNNKPENDYSNSRRDSSTSTNSREENNRENSNGRSVDDYPNSRRDSSISTNNREENPNYGTSNVYLNSRRDSSTSTNNRDQNNRENSNSRPINERKPKTTPSPYYREEDTNGNSNYNPVNEHSSGSRTVDTPFRINPENRNNYDNPQNTNNSGGSYPRRPIESSNRRPTTTTVRSTRPIYDSAEDYSDNSGSTSKRNRNNDYFDGDRHVPDEFKIRPTPLPGRDSSRNDGCGKVAIQARPLILGGQPTKEGEWPWHVAIYHAQEADNSKYICGGSLISASHVITAAHCVTRRSSARPVNHQTLTVFLGKYNLRISSESVQVMLIRKISIHPDFNHTNFYADLAILHFNKPSEYTQYARPICLWKESNTNLDNIVDKVGTVVGWGFDESGTVTEDLTLVKMPVVKQSTCLWSFKEFYTHFTSEQSYCAGFENGTSVCNGDSGGGMVFAETEYGDSTPTWRLRGIVSISVAKQHEQRCDPYHYVVFTDSAQFIPWIKQKIA